MNVNIKDYYRKKNIEERNKWFNMFFVNNNMERLNVEEIKVGLDICFDLFKENFYNNEYDEFVLIADICESLVNEYLKKKEWEDITQSYEDVDFLIDIVCFVYELTYKYVEKTDILKKIIDTETVDVRIKIRALENILVNEPAIKLYLKNDYEKYSLLLKNIKNN